MKYSFQLILKNCDFHFSQFVTSIYVQKYISDLWWGKESLKKHLTAPASHSMGSPKNCLKLFLNALVNQSIVEIGYGGSVKRNFNCNNGNHVSQEDEGAPIYWSRAPIYWSPWILFSKFWDGLRRESSDKTRFCVSHDGPTNGLETFCLPCFMFKNKTKNMFVEPKGLQYNGA